MIQFEINGNTFKDPNNWQELSERSYYSPEVFGYLYEINGTLSFYGDAFDYLRNLYFSDGCAVVPCTVTIDSRRINVNIFLNDAIWRLRKCNVEVEFVENTYTSYISNNKDIKAYLNVPRSKNDVDITAYTTVTTGCTFKGYETGVDADATNREGVRLYDAFKFIMAFISDGEMDFASDYMATESDPANPSINRNPTLFDPQEISQGGGSAYPYISFQELMNDTFCLYNVNFGIEIQSNGRPLFRIEQPEYFRSSLSGITLTDPNEITQQSDISKFYQLLKIGSSQVLSEHTYYDPIQLYSWDKEEYHLGGTCNNETILDIECKTIITDTNIIQDALPVASGGTLSDGYWGDVALVLLDGNDITIVSDNPINSIYQNYNGRLKNDEVLSRFYGSIPQSIFLFLGEGQNDARGEIQSVTPVSGATLIPCPVHYLVSVYANFTNFPNEVVDQNNNMSIDPSTFEFNALSQSNVTVYTSPVSGVYEVAFDVRSTHDWRSQNGAIYLVVYRGATTYPIALFPFGGSFIDNNAAPTIMQGYGGQSERGSMYEENGAYVCTGSQTMFLASGDKVCVMSTFRFNPNISTDYLSVSYFEVFDNLTTTKTYDPATNYLIKTDIETVIDCDTWNQYLLDKNAEITIIGNGHHITGYVNDIERNATTGKSSVSILGKFATSK